MATKYIATPLSNYFTIYSLRWALPRDYDVWLCLGKSSDKKKIRTHMIQPHHDVKRNQPKA